MATTRRKSKSFKEYLKNLIFSSQVFPFILTFSVMGILFVLFRMKGVEINYKIASFNKDIDKIALENKELKAKKARLLSIKRLRGMAKSYELKQPKRKQIIVIPK
ncbi:hypothetical protein OAT67_00615 [Bacteriovoracaceae bacterium]|nr:hypothetical protein [Bacteriovoracaceae bacterium]